MKILIKKIKVGLPKEFFLNDLKNEFKELIFSHF